MLRFSYSVSVAICYRKHTFNILKAKTATLSDANFEKLMFMKENDQYVETMELGGAGGQSITRNVGQCPM